MPLINLTTNLTNLRYGGDRPGGGSSGLPYIISPRPEQIQAVPFPLQQSNYLQFYSANRDSRDFPIRGGSLLIGGAYGLNTTLAGQIDEARIYAFLKDAQKGEIFLLKQQGLQLSNPKVPGLGTVQSFNPTIGFNFIENTRVYNPRGSTTLLQTLTQGTGTHIVRHGLIPNTNEYLSPGYEQFARNNNDDTANRLLLLRQAKLLPDTPSYLLATYSSRALDYGISILTNEILNYEGGPGSVYGIGKTIIRRVTNTNSTKAYSTIALSYDAIDSQATTEGRSRSHPRMQDYRLQVNDQVGSRVQPNWFYNDSLENRLQTGNPGGEKSQEDLIDYKTSIADGVDRLNAQNVFYYNTETEPWNQIISGEAPPEDIIKFVFECLSNDYPGEASAIIFRAFLSGISDNHQAEYNTFKYLGRGETFRVYQGFDRSVGFSFKIAAFTREEMPILYTKLNHLISQVYPDYSPGTRFMRGNVVKLTIGDYFYRVPGYLDSINISIDDNVSWEIAFQDPDMRQLPQVINVQCSFKPIHDILPRREKDDLTSNLVPLIADNPLNPSFLQSRQARGANAFNRMIADAIRQDEEEYIQDQLAEEQAYIDRLRQEQAAAAAANTPVAIPTTTTVKKKPTKKKKKKKK